MRGWQSNRNRSTKAQTKTKATPEVKAKLKLEPKGESKACTDQGKTQEAGPSGTYREEQVTLPEGDAYTSNRSSDQRLGFCQIVHEKSCWQDGFHWSGLKQKLFLCMPCGCGAATATASAKTAKCADFVVWGPVQCLDNCEDTGEVGQGSAVHAANHTASTAKGVSLWDSGKQCSMEKRSAAPWVSPSPPSYSALQRTPH